MIKEKCIKHEYHLVNNRYENGKQVTEGGEWVTESRCEKCDELFELPEYLINYDTKKV